MSKDRLKSVKCPLCVAAGERSIVQDLGTRMTLLGGQTPWYDEDGDYHDHDPNWRRQSFSCSKGHAWETKFMRPCPTSTCGYGRTPR